MRAIAILLLVLNSTICVVDSQTTNEWRGIVPLRSTRTDVERLLGQASNECQCAYYLGDVNVFFQFSSGDCKDGGSGGWNVPPETVIRFTVVPKPRPQLSDLRIDESQFRKKQSGHIEGIVEYVNEKEGLIVEVQEGAVGAFIHIPALRDEHLRCR